MSVSAFATATHEAGHAVIARVLNLTCGAVSIVRKNDDLGYAEIENPLIRWERGDGSRRAWAEAFCIALYAGGEAEREIAGSILDGDQQDCERATNCLSIVGVRGASFIGDEYWERREANLRLRARRLVRQYQREIKLVAQALVERGCLSDDDVRQAMTDASAAA